MKSYCLKCNNNTKNQTVKNKVIRAKSKCATCMANKSRLKKVVGNINSSHYETCKVIVGGGKQIQKNLDPKVLKTKNCKKNVIIKMCYMC